MSGGTINMFGRVSFASSATCQFIMSGGNINVDAQAGNNLATSTNAMFQLNALTTVNWSGGTVTLVDPPLATSTSAYTAFVNATGVIKLLPVES